MSKKNTPRLLSDFIVTARRVLGPVGVCIYPISCTDYARLCLNQKRYSIAIPLILIRLISCNPITALLRIIKWKLQ